MDIKSLWQKLDQIAESGDTKSIPESKKKKPDADGDGVPDWADKKPGKDDNEDKKKDVAENSSEKSSRLKASKSSGRSIGDAYSDLKNVKDVAEGLDENDPELKNVKHFAKPGGYGRKIDKEDPSGDKFHSSDIDDTDDTSTAKAPVKRGRGRPMKGGDSETGITKKYDTDTLSSWIIGNKPKNIGKIGKVSHVNRLKEYMEMVERQTIVEGYIAEGRMSELSSMVDDIIDGRLDIYDIISGKFTPTNDLEEFVQKTLIKSYDTIAGEQGLRADDDHEDIIGIMYNDIHDIMSNALNKGIDEQAMPGTIQPGTTTPTGQSQTGMTTPTGQSSTPGTTQQQVPVRVNGQIVGMAPNQASAQQATQKMTQNTNNQKELEKLGFTQVQESLSDTMNKFASILNESQGRRTLSESKTPMLVLEGTLEEIIAVHPHEHKMCQDGWGMDESLYEALCDHYHKEGRIPRKVWHGSSEDLRKCVEECYMQDTQSLMSEGIDKDEHEPNRWALNTPPDELEDELEDDDYDYSEPLRDDGRELYPSDEDVFYPYDVDDLEEDVNYPDELRDKMEWLMTTYHMRSGEAEHAAYYDNEPETWKGSPWENEYGMEEGFAGGALGGIAGAALTKSPSGAITGSKFGSDIQDSLAKKSPFENEEMDLRRHAMSSLIDELDESTYGTLKTDMSESKKPSAGMTKDEKSSLVKKAKSGKDIGKSGKGFDKLAKKAGEKYGSAEKGKKVAASAMWKNAAPTTESKEDDFDKASIAQGKRGRAARDNPTSSVALNKKSKTSQDASKELAKLRDTQRDLEEDQINEGKFSQMDSDLVDLSPSEFKKEYGMTKAEARLKHGGKKPTEKSDTKKIDEMDYPGGRSPYAGMGLPRDDDDDAGKKEIMVKPITAKKAVKSAEKELNKSFDKEFSKSSKSLKESSTVDASQMHAGTFKIGDKAMARDGSQVTIAKVEGDGDVWIKSWQDKTPQRVDARTLKSVGSSGKPLGESYDFSEWDNQLSSLLKPTSKQSVSESTKIKKQIITESSNELSTMLQFAGLKNVQQVMEEFNASIYSDESNSSSSKEGSDNPPPLAMPTGMGMSQQTEDDDESSVVEPMMSDEVIGGLVKGDKESAKSDNDHLSFFKKMLSHGQSEVKTEKPKSESGEQSGIPASSSQSTVSGNSSEKSVTEDDMEEGNAFTGALAKAKSNGVQSGEKMDVDGDGKKETPVKEDATDNISEDDETMTEDEHQGIASDNIIGDILAKLTQLIGSEQDQQINQPAMSAEQPVMIDVQSYTDGQDYADEESQDEQYCDQCQSCGGPMNEDHQCMESLNEWANSPTGESVDEQFQTDMEFMTKVISGGLNNQKQDQTTLPSTRVVTRDESKDVSNSMGEMLRKLSGIN